MDNQFISNPQKNLEKRLMGVCNTYTWATKEVAAINHFNNRFYNCSDSQGTSDNITYIKRGNGIILVNFNGSGEISTDAHGLASGTYTDEVSGNTFKVSDGTTSEYGIAVIYQNVMSNPTTKHPAQIATNLGNGSVFYTNGLDVDVTVMNATSASYSASTGESGTLTGEKTVTIGKGLKDGQTVTLTVKATSSYGTVTKKFTYTKQSKAVEISTSKKDGSGFYTDGFTLTMEALYATNATYTTSDGQSGSFATTKDITIGTGLKVGEKVTDLKVGDMVATGYEGCGHCPACREGHIDQCEEIRNDTEDGYKWGFFGFSNYCVKNSSGVYKVANDLNPSEAGFMEPLATVIHGAKKLRLKPFETVVVIGAGTMGLINAQTAKAYGCRVIVSEMIPKKIETAKAMGFEVIDCNESDPVEKVKELTEGIGADAVIVAVGATSANSQGLEMLKQNDGRMLLFAAGYPVPELKVDSNMLHYRKMELIGTFGADHEDFKEAAQALSTKVVDVSKLVEEKKFPLSRLQEAYEEASKPGMYRVSVMLDEE